MLTSLSKATHMVRSEADPFFSLIDMDPNDTHSYEDKCKFLMRWHRDTWPPNTDPRGQSVRFFYI